MRSKVVFKISFYRISNFVGEIEITRV